MTSSLPLRLKTRPAFCRSLWEKVEATQSKPKLVLPSEATIRARFYSTSTGGHEIFTQPEHERDPANNLIASATQLNAPIPRAAVRARNRYSRAGHRNIADRQISG